MALVRVSPTHFDQTVAKTVSAHTDPKIEDVAEALTWGADEHLLLPAAVLFWLGTRDAGDPVRRLSRHLLVTTLVTAALPHVLKAIFNQERPDREAIAAHRKGIPISGKKDDAFPSGHALHMGALASVATLFPRRTRNAAWGIAAVLSATRVALLAHWLSDVLVGLVMGTVVERSIRKITAPVPMNSTAGKSRKT